MLMVGYVHPGMVHQEFSDSLIKLYQYDSSPKGRRIIGGQCAVRGLYVADSRNTVCKKFLEAKYPDGTQPEWLLFLDTDIIFKPTDVYDLLDHATEDGLKSIIGGLYFGFVEGNPSPVWREIHNDPKYFGWGTMKEVRIGVVEPIDAVGMGFTLIHRSALEAVKAKYSHDKWTWFFFDEWHGERLGEDLTFCYRAAQVGHKTWGDSKVIVGHIKPFTIDLQMFTDAIEKAQREKARTSDS